MHPLIEANRSALRALGARYGVRSIRVFGSMARDDADEHSDVDLLVDAAPGVSGFALGALLMDAQELLARKVDVVTEAALHPLIRERVLREAQPL
jgi:predicted nucleotidyltransferase